MPSITSSIIRKQISLIKPILTKSSIETSRTLQEKLGKLGATVVAEEVSFSEFDLAGVEAAWAIPVDVTPDDKRVALYLHGGGYVAGSINYAKGFAGILASKLNIKVMCIAYHLAPEYPFPAALEDALAAYEFILSLGYKEKDISLIGESAGGGLIFSLCLALKQQGRPMPARVVALSPWTDLTMSGGSYEENRKVDVSLTEEEIGIFVDAYSPDDQKNPLVSPLLGELSGLPDTHIYVGGDEILLDDSRMMAKRLEEAGVCCKLTVEEGMWHAYVLYGVPEANDALDEIQRFFKDNIND